MLKMIKKAVIKQGKGTEEMTQQTQAAPVAVAVAVDTVAELAAAQALLATQTVSLADLVQKVALLTTDLDVTNAALGEALEAKAALEKTALETKLSARKTRIVAQVGDEKADAFLTATNGLDDVSFEAVANALTGSLAAEAKSAMHTEVGASAEVDAAKLATEESPLAKKLREKYHAVTA